ncbi:T-cell activation Rho GTPase-activating protein-like [Grus japonensis]|uniref:T-cell activation Rho GTPase-activating protein-like n=1 Tax=Grus japonensis TaxID=30415 RepID=A0ABC9W3G0_GRUJA
MGRGIQYLRELAMWEMVYYDPDNTQLPTDPDEVQCTQPMWRKFVWSAPSSYASSLAVMDWKGEEAPMVDEVACRFRQYEESLSSSLVSAVEKLSQKLQQLKENMSCSSPVRTSISAIRMTVGDEEPRDSKDTRVIDGLETMEGQVVIRASPLKQAMESVAKLKCIYTNTCSMGKKQQELEAIVQLENYDIVAITETWWDDSHNWAAAVDGYKLFRRDRQGRRGGGVALYVKECFDCLEPNGGDGRVECLWVRIREKANKADIMVGVCYRPPNQDEEVDKIFYKQLEVSRSLALVLVGDFNLPDVCWKYNTAERKQSRRFVKCVEDNFLTQLVSERTREGDLLDLLFVNREGLVGDVTVGGCLGHSDHKMTEFSILREDLLALLAEHGPSTEGIFRLAVKEHVSRELREALDSGAEVHLESQPAHVLAVLLKDFLRKIPSKLLGAELYDEWMSALQKTSRQEKLAALREVAGKLPQANLLLLKSLLSLLQRISRNAASSRMTAGNLAICVGPNLLSPPEEQTLPLDALVQVTGQVRRV